jgi:hydrogenase maturation protease
MTAPNKARCRALVGGFGRPGMRDLDFGRQVVDVLQQLDWPDGVVIEDLSCAAPLVLHRLQELEPATVVLVGAVARDLDPPGTLRRYRVDLTPPAPAEVHRNVEESVMGIVDLDHTLAMARHWGGLPVDTTVIEVEPADASFGLGFSETLATCIDPMLEMVREELARVGERAGGHPDFDAHEASTHGASSAGFVGTQVEVAQPTQALDDLLGYAEHHAQARLEVHRGPALVEELSSAAPGVALVGQVRPWGVFVERGGDWFDAVPLDGGRLGIVVGNVDGRGVEAAGAMSDLRAAVRAYAVLDGESPARLVRHLDRLAQTTGLGDQARVLYLLLQPSTGEARYASAGGCPPLLLDRHAPHGRFVDGASGPPLGPVGAGARGERTLVMTAESTMLLFTAGLVQSASVSRAAGLERLRQAAGGGPAGLDDLCAHVLTTCTGRLRRDDDLCLLGVRLTGGDAAVRESEPQQRCAR